MKNFLKILLFVIFTMGSLCLSAQTSIVDKIEHLIDSLEQIDASKSHVANRQYPMPAVIKQVDVRQAFSQVEVRGDVTIILTNGPADRFWLKGNINDLEQVSTTVKNEKLIVNARKEKNASKIILYVSILDVTALIINDDTEIFSAGTIRTGDLQIFLNGTSMVSLKYNGKLDVVAGESAELVYDKKITTRN